MGKVIFGLLVGATLGFVLRMVLIESRAGAPIESEREGAVSTREEVDASAAARRPEAAPAVVPAPGERPPEGGPVDDAGAPASLEGTFIGIVASEIGEPLEGVRIRARPALERLTLAAGESAADFSARALDHARRHAAATREATSDAEGRYRITGLARGVPHDVEAEHEGWRFLPRRWGAQDPIPDARVEFVGTRAGWLQVEVRRADGELARAATIWVDAPGGEAFSHRWTPDRRRLLCPLGAARLQARDAAGRESPKTDLFVRASDQAVALSLSPVRAVEGSIEFPGPWGDGLDVHAVKIEEGGTTPTDQELLGGSVGAVDTRRGCSFLVRGLAAGRHALAAFVRRGFQRVTEVAIVEVPDDGMISCRLQGLAVDTSGLVAVRILGAEGEIISNPSISHLKAGRLEGSPLVRRQLDLQRDREGRVGSRGPPTGSSGSR
ncbi:MAG: hypothetical protein R3F20_06865 [Planctomycetota bacterium]